MSDLAPWQADVVLPDGPTLVLATNNPRKLEEMQRLVADHDLQVTVLGLSDLPRYQVPRETGTTFEDNALLKARAAAEMHQLPALADDSGLEVAALNGMPGIRSARWAGPEATDDENLALLLRQIDDVPESERQASFVCAIALVMPADADGQAREHVVRREWPGRITTAPAGANGFGYDPIFAPADCTGTSAQLDEVDKDRVSHRGQALRAIMSVIRAELGEDPA